MKYRLKKDLPFAKAGEEVVVEASTVMGYKEIKISHNSPVFCSVNNDYVNDWIEEIKPNEYYIVERRVGGRWEAIDKLYSSLDEAETHYNGWLDQVRFRKVQVIG